MLQGSYSWEADSWSIGVMLYIMLCGMPPFWGRTDGEIFQRVRDFQRGRTQLLPSVTSPPLLPSPLLAELCRTYILRCLRVTTAGAE